MKFIKEGQKEEKQKRAKKKTVGENIYGSF